MKQFYIALPHIIALISLMIGIVCLIVSVMGEQRSDLLFALVGAMALLLTVLDPQASGAAGNSDSSVLILAKRFLLSLSVAYVTWFMIERVTAGITSRKIITCAVALFACLAVPFYASQNYNLAVLSELTSLIAISIFAILGARMLAWRWEQSVNFLKLKVVTVFLISYQVIFLLTVLIHLARLAPIYNTTSLLHLFLLGSIFVISVVIMLLLSLIENSLISGEHESNERRIQSILKNAPLMVFEVEPGGKILHVNEFGVKALAYETSRELEQLNWFDSILASSDAALGRKVFADIATGNIATSSSKNIITCKNGQELVISSVSFGSDSGGNQSKSVINICRDLSEEESANRLVAQLQKELEKENIGITRDVRFELEENVIGKSKSFTYALQRARQVAITHAPVLLEGETGVGKEVFANLIHKNSSRSKMAFIKVNCGALPKELIEDELFGHEKGAFTSAIQARKGRFELADGGTIFLDEIGELPLDMQPKLLRVLQNGEFERVGGQKTIVVDVRILAATNRNLLTEIGIGNFREDLYYRLNVFPITIPPLRNRREDLPDLINYFIATKCKEYNKVLEQISSFDLQRLVAYRWPGNIRELKNVIERAVIVSEGNVLKLNWWTDNEPAKEAGGSQSLEKIEHDHIVTVMDKCRWKINGENGAAQILNMHPNTLRSKMKRLGIFRPHLAASPEYVSDAGYFAKESLG